VGWEGGVEGVGTVSGVFRDTIVKNYFSIMNLMIFLLQFGILCQVISGFFGSVCIASYLSRSCLIYLTEARRL